MEHINKNPFARRRSWREIRAVPRYARRRKRVDSLRRLLSPRRLMGDEWKQKRAVPTRAEQN